MRHLAVLRFTGEETPARLQERCGQLGGDCRRTECPCRHPVDGAPQRIDRHLAGVESENLDPVTPTKTIDRSTQQIGSADPPFDQGPASLGKRIGEDQRRKTDTAAEIHDRTTEGRRLLERDETHGMTAMGFEGPPDLTRSMAFEKQLLERGGDHLSRQDE